MNVRTCPWCNSADDDVDPDTLCRSHLAEFEGLSIAELDRMEHAQYLDEL